MSAAAALKLADEPPKRQPKRRRKQKVADLFCGAGGTSLAIKEACDELRLDMELVVVNHWDVAIATHQQNFPQARHYCQDIGTVRPPAAVPEGYLDLLTASPTCTHHSRARGGKPTSDQQRMDPWHVVTWLTELRVKRLLIENVPEFVDWGPVDARTGRPIRSRKGEYFRAWVRAIEGLGYKVTWRVDINAADYGDATTRVRFFLMARNDGKPLRWPEPTHARVPTQTLFHRPLEKWRAAREIIDWNLKGTSIFNRPRPLAPATLARIYAGIVKFGWPDPFLIVLRQHMAGRGLDVPLPAITAGGTHIGLVQPGEPFVLAPATGGAPRRVSHPLPTITTGGAGTEGRPGCARPALIEPFILNRHGENGGTRAHSVDEPIPTADCRGAGYMVEPFVLSQGAGGAPRAANEPLPTIPGGGAHALIAPYYGSGSGETCRSADEPLPTATAKGRFGLVVPITHGNPAGDGRARSVDSPLPTITTANRGELAFITAAFGERPGQEPRVHSVDDPMPTICAQGRIPLIEGVGYDILYRMLQPPELAAAMSIIEPGRSYHFTGTKTEITKQIGNAVPKRTAKALIKELMAA